mmetsp:Transcript_108589/g.346660  ORF Transcript_108589/g.346660 Transcript_108589/m.346660 type:complete len:117 (+) Transcript_108589:1086-1436(+)
MTRSIGLVRIVEQDRDILTLRVESRHVLRPSLVVRGGSGRTWHAAALASRSAGLSRGCFWSITLKRSAGRRSIRPCFECTKQFAGTFAWWPTCVFVRAAMFVETLTVPGVQSSVVK